jgi:hypothetical protein
VFERKRKAMGSDFVLPSAKKFAIYFMDTFFSLAEKKFFVVFIFSPKQYVGVSFQILSCSIIERLGQKVQII